MYYSWLNEAVKLVTDSQLLVILFTIDTYQVGKLLYNSQNIRGRNHQQIHSMQCLMSL